MPHLRKTLKEIRPGYAIHDEIDVPKVISFTFEGKLLFTIHRDGHLEKGEGFTTEDEMSLKFWELVMNNFDLAWWRGLIKHR